MRSLFEGLNIPVERRIKLLRDLLADLKPRLMEEAPVEETPAEEISLTATPADFELQTPAETAIDIAAAEVALPLAAEAIPLPAFEEIPAPTEPAMELPALEAEALGLLLQEPAPAAEPLVLAPVAEAAPPGGELLTEELSDEEAFARFAALDREAPPAMTAVPLMPLPLAPLGIELLPAGEPGDLITQDLSDEDAFARFAAAEKGVSVDQFGQGFGIPTGEFAVVSEPVLAVAEGAMVPLDLNLPPAREIAPDEPAVELPEPPAGEAAAEAKDEGADWSAAEAAIADIVIDEQPPVKLESQAPEALSIPEAPSKPWEVDYGLPPEPAPAAMAPQDMLSIPEAPAEVVAEPLPVAPPPVPLPRPLVAPALGALFQKPPPPMSAAAPAKPAPLKVLTIGEFFRQALRKSPPKPTLGALFAGLKKR